MYLSVAVLPPATVRTCAVNPDHKVIRTARTAIVILLHMILIFQSYDEICDLIVAIFFRNLVFLPIRCRKVKRLQVVDTFFLFFEQVLLVTFNISDRYK